MMRASPSHSVPKILDPTWRIGIVASLYYKEEMDALVDGAVRTLLHAGLPEDRIMRFDVAGSFEIPLVGAALAEEKRVDALIGLGIIVEGETSHARLLAENVARAIMDTQMRFLVPFAFEVLHVADLAQARARIDKGEEAARAVVHSLAQLSRIRS